jgi:hypothetical protein
MAWLMVSSQPVGIPADDLVILRVLGVAVLPAPPIVAATATVSRPSASSCWRHLRRNSRRAQRMTARRAGTPPWPVPAQAGPAGYRRGAHRAGRSDLRSPSTP